MCMSNFGDFRHIRFRATLKVVVALIFLLTGIAGIATWATLSAPKDPLTWDTVFASIQRDWPEVPQMSTQELARRMEADDEARPLLIDVRTREEYEVSHLPGAIWAETPDQIACALRGASDRKAVVLYCSVGVRAGRRFCPIDF